MISWSVVVFAGNTSIVFDSVFFFQAEDGIRDLVRSRGLGDVYKRQGEKHVKKSIVGNVLFICFYFWRYG